MQSGHTLTCGHLALQVFEMIRFQLHDYSISTSAYCEHTLSCGHLAVQVFEMIRVQLHNFLESTLA